MVMEKVAPTWHVVGAGNLGCLWASRLFKHNIPCRIHVRDEKQLSSYPGIHVWNKDTRIFDRYPVPCTTMEHVVEQRATGKSPLLERVLVCTKSFDVEHALASIAPALATNCVVVVLANGIISPRVEEMLPREAKLFAASTTEGAHPQDRFFITPAGHGETILGPYKEDMTSKSTSPHVPSFTEDDADADADDGGAPPHTYLPPHMLMVENIRPLLWRKLLINCVINPLGALHKVRNGLIPSALGVEDYKRVEREIVSEVIAIAQAHGVSLSLDDSLAVVAQTMDSTSHNRCSMLQDVTAEKRTEIDALNGFIANEGARLGIPTPCNKELAGMVRALYSPQSTRAGVCGEGRTQRETTPPVATHLYN